MLRGIFLVVRYLGLEVKSVSDIRETESVEEKNKKYFKSFIETRGGIHLLQISLVGLVITLLCLPITWNVALLGYGINPLQSKINILIICTAIFMLVTFLAVNFNFSRQFLIQHQAILGILGFVQSVLLNFILMFMFYMLTQLNQPNEIWYGSNFSLRIILLFSLAYLSSLIYNVYWLRKQLRIGFSKERRAANYLAKTKVYESRSLLIIFACSLLGSFLTGNIVKVFALVCGLFFAAVFSRLTLELGYAAYLLAKDKNYWIEISDRAKKPWQVTVKKRFKQKSTYVILGVLVIVVMSRIKEKYELLEVWQVVFSYFTVGFLIWLGLAFIAWIIKKVKNKNTGGIK